MMAVHEPVKVKRRAFAGVSPVSPRIRRNAKEGTMRKFAVIGALAALAMSTASAQENYESWPLMKSEFPSTGGGGIIIKDYDPVITGGKCVTDFSAHTPDGKAYYNVVEFEIVDVAGGKLCTNGKWRAKDGSASGTTPFRIFIKDGVRRSAP